MQVTSTFWAATHSLPRAELSIIPTMKEEIQGFHMAPNFKKSVDPRPEKSAASRSIMTWRQFFWLMVPPLDRTNAMAVPHGHSARALFKK